MGDPGSVRCGVRLRVGLSLSFYLNFHYTDRMNGKDQTWTIKISVIIFLFLVCFPLSSFAQTEIMQDKHETVLARVIEIVAQETKNIPGTDTPALHQKIKVELLEGWQEGQTVQIDNDYLNLKEGEKFYVLHTIDWDSKKDYYSVQEKYRLPNLLILTIIFIGVALYFGRGQGFRGLISLLGSMLLIVCVLISRKKLGPFSPEYRDRR